MKKLYSVEREYPVAISTLWDAWINPDAHTIEIDFKDRGASSWVRFTQIGELPADQAEGAKAGMESYFDNLAKFLIVKSSGQV